jgi:predicted dehydrogenase
MMGKKRAKALGTARLVACVDVLLERALALAQMVPGAIATRDWRAVLDDSKVDIVIVSTTNNMLAEVTLAAVQAGKHVLVEKPGARRSRDIKVLMEAAQRSGRKVRVGFNHRYHPSLRKAHELLEAGALGEMMLVRGRYGHGGRLGYEKEWRADPALSGGGELIDQGAHLIDLSRWFLGDFSEATGFAHTYFWKMPVEDNAFLILKTPQQQVAHLHVSCTEWKNLFSLEIYGRSGKLHIEGLGGSYGLERLSYYKMLPQMGPPETTIWEYPMDDNSWHTEFGEFLEDIKLGRTPSANLNDALAVLSVIEKVYTESGYDYHP